MNVNPWEGQVAAIFDGVRVVSPAQFTLGGGSFSVSGGAAALAAAYAPRQALERRREAVAAGAPGNGSAGSAPLVAKLADVLYTHCYCRPFTGGIQPEAPVVTRPDTVFMDALSSANTTRERWESGWKIAHVQSMGQVVAERPGQRRSLWGGEYVSEDGPASVPRAGAAIRVYRARESRSLQPGVYHAFGETAAEALTSVGTARVYWNLKSGGGPDLMRALTPRLNLFSVPFRLKCLASPALFGRADGGVLYFPKEYFRPVAVLIDEVYSRLRPHLADEIPLFTRRLAPGLAGADDPANGDSFGQHRCRLVAEAIWRAYEKGEQSVESRRGEFESVLESGGVEREHWHLNQGSRDVYEIAGLSEAAPEEQRA